MFPSQSQHKPSQFLWKLCFMNAVSNLIIMKKTTVTSTNGFQAMWEYRNNSTIIAALIQ